MTPAISTLLLLPGEGREGLLAPGAPVGDDSGARGWVVPRGPLWPLGNEHCKPQNSAAVGTGLMVWRPGYGVTALRDWGLLLADEGKPVTAGCDLLDRAACPDSTHQQQQAHALVASTLEFGPHSAPCRSLLRWLDRNHLGALIALDPSGRDITAEVLGG